MKLRIVSDGSMGGTRLETDDGRRIDGVVKIDWHASVEHHCTTAEIELIMPEVRLEAAAGAVICRCGDALQEETVCTHRIRRGIETVYGKDGSGLRVASCELKPETRNAKPETERGDHGR